MAGLQPYVGSMTNTCDDAFSSFPLIFVVVVGRSVSQSVSSFVYFRIETLLDWFVCSFVCFFVSSCFFTDGQCKRPTWSFLLLQIFFVFRMTRLGMEKGLESLENDCFVRSPLFSRAPIVTVHYTGESNRSSEYSMSYTKYGARLCSMTHWCLM